MKKILGPKKLFHKHTQHILHIKNLNIILKSTISRFLTLPDVAPIYHKSHTKLFLSKGISFFSSIGCQGSGIYFLVDNAGLFLKGLAASTTPDLSMRRNPEHSWWMDQREQLDSYWRKKVVWIIRLYNQHFDSWIYQETSWQPLQHR